jgi:membrane-associated phospholipid phosphatase
LHAYFEIAYLLCYPMIPTGMAVLYCYSLRERVDDYWLVVLPSTYACYLMQPLVSALPPRLVAAEPKDECNPSAFRRLNLWIHRWASIRFITLPSAHVASTIAASLVLVRLVPAVGMLFLGLSLSIAVAAVVERYHYAADVLLGIAIAAIVVLITTPMLFT